MKRHRLILASLSIATLLGVPWANANGCLREVGRWPYGPTTAVSRNGDLIYLGTGSELQVWRFAPPDELALLAHLDLPRAARDIAIDGDLAVVAVGDLGLVLVDITDPTDPLVLAGIGTRGFAAGVEVDDGVAWVAATRRGIRAYDITDPSRPRLVGVVVPAILTEDVTVAGDVLWAASSDGLHAIDIGDPRRPSVLSSVHANGLRTVTVEDGLAYVAGVWGGLRIFDVSNPSAPVQIGQFVQWELPTSDVAVDGTTAFVACFEYLSVVDVSDPAQPVEIAVDPEIGDADGRTLAAGGGWLAVADGANGLRVVDVSDPEHPDIVVTRDVPGFVGAVAATNDLLLVAADLDQEGGFRVLDFADPVRPAVIGGPVGPDLTNYREMAVVGGFAYAADLLDGIHVFDITDPTDPQYVRTTGGPLLYGYGLADSNGWLAVATSNWGLAVFDLAQLSEPTEIARLELPGEAQDVATSGDLAFVTGYDLGLAIVDLGDPSDPILISHLPGIRGRQIALDGSLAYIAAAYDGLVIIDVDQPLSPREVGRFVVGDIEQIAVRGDLAAVTSWQRGDCETRVLFLDISDPTSPVERGFSCVANPHLAVAGDLIVVADALGGIRLLDPDRCLRPNPFPDFTPSSTDD